ncbi:sigma-70 family RNA polymerase sigma factor [Aporhodopirellula aestuarii]|uniref:Sigma-70 family RNA polymerase sigma factor n=1 Tax=Aporhodopirellula aestuarii TaxID=2950107 RepID=A0ABT0U367_9BACT|nr:sigma-70 family RNA polymerase sigma factor [Aporhodopirellula aestuarii]MCM2371253.1 sigma-70 family RNA polymerase sigma factor [Aporhodopirellula aestuarii]
MSDSNEETAEFIQLLTESQRMLFQYIHSLIPHRNDADEVLQETNLVLWREYHQFQQGTNFRAWACTVALNQVRAFTSKRRAKRPFFDTDTMMLISERQQKKSAYFESRLDALERCVKKLPQRKRMFVEKRYRIGFTIETIAKEMGSSVDAAYKMLRRIRDDLHTCVDRTLSQEGLGK